MKPTFSEVIKVKEGVFYNLPCHTDRMNRTTRHFFGKEIKCDLAFGRIPAGMRNGLVKCRIVYSDEIHSVEFVPYSFKSIHTVAVVHDDAIEYMYKSTDRTRLDSLLKASGCDEIIIVKNGYVTDSSSANLVLEDASGLYTPADCLLRGTKRESLLNSGMISERAVQLVDIKRAIRIFLINAMMDLEDGIVFYPAMIVF